MGGWGGGCGGWDFLFEGLRGGGGGGQGCRVREVGESRVCCGLGVGFWG